MNTQRRLRLALVVVGLLGVAAARPAGHSRFGDGPIQLAQVVIADPVGEGDAPIDGAMIEGAPVGNAPIGGPAVEGAPVGDAPIGGPMIEGAPVGDGPVGGPSMFGAPVDSGSDGEPIGGDTLY